MYHLKVLILLPDSQKVPCIQLFLCEKPILSTIGDKAPHVIYHSQKQILIQSYIEVVSPSETLSIHCNSGDMSGETQKLRGFLQLDKVQM